MLIYRLFWPTVDSFTLGLFCTLLDQVAVCGLPSGCLWKFEQGLITGSAIRPQCLDASGLLPFFFLISTASSTPHPYTSTSPNTWRLYIGAVNHRISSIVSSFRPLSRSFHLLSSPFCSIGNRHRRLRICVLSHCLNRCLVWVIDIGHSIAHKNPHTLHTHFLHGYYKK